MGTLYIVSTPIGNLEDITLRALKVLKEVDSIICEDTRHTKKLLEHYQIEKQLESFFEHNEDAKINKIVHALESGKNLALVSDAGTPTISDPGFKLVRILVEKGISIVPMPGPSAALAALSVSGLPTDRFLFIGFLPQKMGKRKNFLEELRSYKGTVVAYESPNRLVFTLQSILEVFGNVPVCVAREITKIHEEFFRGSVLQAIDHFNSGLVHGEITLIFSL